jgi:hypothetical protein
VATFYYVDPAGLGGSPSDGNSGLDTGHPFATLNHAVGVVLLGDTILCRTAIYNESLNAPPLTGNSWAAGHFYTIQAYPGETPWLRPVPSPITGWILDLNGNAYIDFNGINLDCSLSTDALRWGGLATSDLTSHHIRYRNASIIGSRLDGDEASSRNGISLRGAGSGFHEISRVRIYGAGGANAFYGAYCHCSDCLFDGLDISDVGLQGMQVFDNDSAPQRVIVRNSAFHDITQGHDGRRNGLLLEGNNHVAYNNRYWNIGSGTPGGAQAMVLYTGDGNKHFNNTAYNIDGAWLAIAGSSSNGQAKNNIAYLAGTVADFGGVATQLAANLEGNPNFVNAGSADFHLTSDSLARDTGIDLTSFFQTPAWAMAPAIPDPSDADGIHRPQGSQWDRGAYEFVSGSPPPPLPWQPELQQPLRGGDRARKARGRSFVAIQQVAPPPPTTVPDGWRPFFPLSAVRIPWRGRTQQQDHSWILGVSFVSSEPKFLDRVMETSTTTGTGTYTLAGAVTGFQAFSAVGNGNSCYYAAFESDTFGNPTGGWETGIGTYASGGTTLSRDSILSSSNGGSAVNWAAGTRRIMIAPLATLFASAADGAVFRRSGSSFGMGAVNLASANAVTGVLPLANYATNELDYAEFTSNVSPSATTEGTANTIVTGNAVTYDGSTVVLIEFFTVQARPDVGAAGRRLTLCLYEDGSSIGQMGIAISAAAAGDNKPVKLARRMTPSAGSHTYSIRGFVDAGTALVAAGTGSSGNALPGFIRITRK